MLPRTEMTSSAFSFLALRSDSADYAKTIANNSVDSDKIVDRSVEGDDLAIATLEGFHLQDSTVQFRKIGTNGATEGQVMKMVGGNWTAAADETGSGGGDITAVLPGSGLTGGGTSGDVTLSVGPDAINSSHIAANAVGTDEIGLYGVDTDELAHYAVTSLKIADNAVTLIKMATGSVSYDEIIDGTVRTDELANNAVTGMKILDGTIQSSDIADGGVGLVDIAQSGATESQAIVWSEGAWQPSEVGDITSVTATELGGLTGGGTEGNVSLGIEPNGVTTGLISNNTIMDEDISASADISPDKINGTAVTLSGDQLIEGNKTFENLNISTTTRRLALSSAAFVPISNSYSYVRTGGYLKNTVNTNQVYQAQVSLPDGAIVTKVKVTYYDNEESYLGWIYL